MVTDAPPIRRPVLYEGLVSPVSRAAKPLSVIRRGPRGLIDLVGCGGRQRSERTQDSLPAGIDATS